MIGIKNYFRRPAYLAALVFLAVLPFFDGGTNFLAEMILLLLPLPLFLLGISRQEFHFARLTGKVIIAYLLFLIFTGVSVFSSASQIFSIPAFFHSLAIFLFFLLFLLSARKDDFRLNFLWLVGVGVILSFLSFWYLLPWSVKPTTGMNLVYATYGHNHLAGYLALILPANFVLFLAAKGRRLKIFWGLLLALFLLSLMLTFSRGAFLVFPLVFFLLLRSAGKLNLDRKVVGWLTVLLPVLMLLFIIGISYSQLGRRAREAAKDHWLVKQVVKPEVRASRFEYWQQGAEGFFARPLTGFGTGAFELVALRFQKRVAGWSNYAHNFYLQTLAESGIFAFLAFIGFLLLVFRPVLRRLRKKKDPWLLGLLAALLTSALYAAWDYDWHFPAVFLTFLFLIASLLVYFSRGVNSNTPGRCTGKMVGVLLLAVLSFLFGVSQLASEWFYQKGNYLAAIQLAPWPAVRTRLIGNKIFEKDFSLGEAVGQRIMRLSAADPSMAAWLADRYYFAGDNNQAEKYYRLAIDGNPLGNWRLYRRLGGIYQDRGKLDQKERLYQEFLAKLGPMKKGEFANNALAKEAYLIGLEYVRDGRLPAAIPWWRLATNFSPEWSYFAVELANFYQALGQKTAAKAALEDCLKYEAPKIHCQSVLTAWENGQPPEGPGDYQRKILQIPDY